MSCDSPVGRASAVGLVCATLFSPLTAAAQAQSAPAQVQNAPAPEAAATAPPNDATERFAQATKLYKDGRFTEALPLFEGLADETDSPNARLYVGHCLVKLGRDVPAYRAFARVLGNSTAPRDDKYDLTREAARTELFALERRVAKIVVAPAETPDGLVVTLDGQPFDPDLFGAPYAVEPGDHRLEARAPGMDSVTRELRLETGESQTLSLALKTTAAPTAPPPAASRADESSSAGTYRMVGFAALGVGVAGIAVFTIAGLSAKSVHDELEADCPDGCSDAEHRDDAARGKTLQNTANAGLVVGLLGAASGTVLLFMGRPSPSENKASLLLAPGGGVLSYRGRF